MKKFPFILLGGILLALTGCSSKPDTTTTSKSVSIFTDAPVLGAVVSDASNQLAQYNPTTRQYEFKNPIVYPVTARATSETFVDVDYDGIATAADLQPKNLPLQSYCNVINIVNDLYYSTNYQDANVTTIQFKQDITERFGIDPCNDPITDQQNAKVLFGAYNFTAADNNLTLIEDIQNDVSKVEDFFDSYLTALDVDSIHYYSFYNALLWLDAKKVTRSDTLHKPNIATVMRPAYRVTASYEDLDVQDIYSDANFIYLAAAHDELATLSPDLSASSRTFFTTGDLDAFGLSLFKQTYDSKECLFLANKKAGIVPFELNCCSIQQFPTISKFYDAENIEQNLSDVGIVSMSGFVSLSENKRLLGISTEDKGFYLINAKDIFTDCNLTRPIDINATLIRNSSGYSVSSLFRDDGSFLYVANKDAGITRYKTQTPTQADIDISKTLFTLKDSAEAYKMALFPNSNELLVTTDKGLQIYDITNNETLSFTADYMMEGSTKDYFSDIAIANTPANKNYIILADGFKGVKIIRLDSSYNPELCGVEYFATADDPTSLAQVTSVRYDSNYLYIGFASEGVKKILFSDLLFQHCR